MTVGVTLLEQTQNKTFSKQQVPMNSIIIILTDTQRDVPVESFHPDVRLF